VRFGGLVVLLQGKQPSVEVDKTRHSPGVTFFLFFPTPPSLRGVWSIDGNVLLLLFQPSKSWRGFVDKTDVRLPPGSVQLYVGVQYNSTETHHLYLLHMFTVGVQCCSAWN
jgi:hypothetical protein